MEKKNTILLTVIAVATLLVAVVGATFAYFTATANPDGNGGTDTVNTTTVGDIDLEMAPVTVSNDLKYPGGFLVVGASVTATDSDTTNDFDLTYQLNGTISNGTATELTWTLYEVESQVATPVTGCTVNEVQVGEETRYNYTGCTVDATILGGTEVKTGTVAAATGEGLVTPGTATVTATGETLTSSNSGAATYYYLVVEYPNKESSQDADQGKSVTATLKDLTNAQSVVHS